MKCPSCSAVTVTCGGITAACHENGCPDRRLQLTGAFVGQYRHDCRECGCPVYSDSRGTWQCDCRDLDTDS